MSKNTSAPVVTDAERAAVISGLRVKGDRYGHAGIAGLAKEIAVRMNGDKLPNGIAKMLVEATGYDKSTVSRTLKYLRENNPTRATDASGNEIGKPVKPRTIALSVDIMSIEKDENTLEAARLAGTVFRRQKGSAGTGTKTEPDFLELLTDWLLEKDDAYEARKSQVDDLMSRMDDIRAERQVTAENAA